VVENVRIVKAFAVQFDRNYSEFSDKLCAAYRDMRESYMQEYQMNLDQNTSRRDDKITEISIDI
jgi:hypothetical protein